MVVRMADDQDRFDEESAWQAVLARDRGADGRFVFGVLSTGIYCRPSCPARRPSRQRVRFFPGSREACAAGFRPCRRCRPDEAARDAAAVREAIAALQAAERRLPLGELAARAGYSPAHFQRLFTRLTGLSPAAYARALRQERAAGALATGMPVAEAIYAAGYSGPSRFYADNAGRGVAPASCRKGGEGEVIRWAIAETSLGPLLVAATAKGVCRVAFGEGEADLAARFPNALLEPGGAEFAGLVGRVVGVVEQPGAGGGIPLDVRGTAFQQAVWRALRQIPPGETRSYAEIAAAAGRPGAVRAAGTANGANPVAVLIPCHRVIRADGSLGGYAWGEAIKRELLRREGGS